MTELMNSPHSYMKINFTCFVKRRIKKANTPQMNQINSSYFLMSNEFLISMEKPNNLSDAPHKQPRPCALKFTSRTEITSWIYHFVTHYFNSYRESHEVRVVDWFPSHHSSRYEYTHSHLIWRPSTASFFSLRSNWSSNCLFNW